MTDLIAVKTVDLAGPALDWAVAQSEGVNTLMLSPRKGEPKKPFALFGSLALSVGGEDQSSYAPSTCWHCGGPLIDKHYPTFSFADGLIRAEVIVASGQPFSAIGPNYLISACRTIVGAKLGDTVQVPEGADAMPKFTATKSSRWFRKAEAGSATTRTVLRL